MDIDNYQKLLQHILTMVFVGFESSRLFGTSMQLIMIARKSLLSLLMEHTVSSMSLGTTLARHGTPRSTTSLDGTATVDLQ